MHFTLFIRLYIIVSLCLLLTGSVIAQPQSKNNNPPDLVIGLIVDQMRPDYVYRYWDHFGDDGFKRLMNT